MNETLPARQAAQNAIVRPVGIYAFEKSLDSPPRRPFASFRGRPDEDHEFIEMVLSVLYLEMNCTAACTAKHHEKMTQERHRIGFGRRRSDIYIASRDAVERFTVHNRALPFRIIQRR